MYFTKIKKIFLQAVLIGQKIFPPGVVELQDSAVWIPNKNSSNRYGKIQNVGPNDNGVWTQDILIKSKDLEKLLNPFPHADAFVADDF